MQFFFFFLKGNECTGQALQLKMYNVFVHVKRLQQLFSTESYFLLVSIQLYRASQNTLASAVSESKSTSSSRGSQNERFSPSPDLWRLG